MSYGSETGGEASMAIHDLDSDEVRQKSTAGKV
jgi:hypothetical protein